MRYTVSAVYDRNDFIGFMQAYTDRNTKIKGMGYITTYGTRWAAPLCCSAVSIICSPCSEPVPGIPK